MAFPAVVSTATTNGTTIATNIVVNLPGALVVGNLLLIFVRKSGDTVNPPVMTWPAGYTPLFSDVSDGSDDRTTAAWRTVDGSEGATITITGNIWQRFAAVAYQISGAEDPVTQPPEFAVITIGNDLSPDPGTVTPTGGAKDYLFFAAFGQQGENSITTYPTDYGVSQLTANSGTAGAVSGNLRVGMAGRALNAAAADPGAFTLAGSNNFWTATTIAVHPPGGGGGGAGRGGGGKKGSEGVQHLFPGGATLLALGNPGIDIGSV